MENKRTFLALPLAHLFAGEIHAFLEKARPRSSGIKWVKPEQVHITLHFFGSTAAEDFPEIERLARKSTETAAPLQLSLEGIGFFPNAVKPRVIWAGLQGDTDQAARLQKDLCRLLRKRGFPVEERPFKPHATLGRIKNPAGCRIPHDLHFEKTVIRSVDHIVFYESRLGSEGSQYEVLETFPFRG